MSFVVTFVVFLYVYISRITVMSWHVRGCEDVAVLIIEQVSAPVDTYCKGLFTLRTITITITTLAHNIVVFIISALSL